jgi:hypothetical protein
MHIYNEEHQTLEIMVYDKRTAMFMGRWALANVRSTFAQQMLYRFGRVAARVDASKVARA